MTWGFVMGMEDCGATGNVWKSEDGCTIYTDAQCVNPQCGPNRPRRVQGKRTDPAYKHISETQLQAMADQAIAQIKSQCDRRTGLPPKMKINRK